MAKLIAPEKKGVPEAVRFGIRLSGITNVPCNQLTPNPLNASLFEEESPSYFRNLTQDIEKRGILVPLVARKNGVLLSGHNRLRVAQELGLSYVPVQYVVENENDELTDEQVREYLVKDNLLRRQFTPDEWLQKYRILYPNFDEEITSASRSTLNAVKIAADTGQNVETVRKHLQKVKKEKTEAHTPKLEKIQFTARQLRDVIERAKTALAMKDVQQAMEILEEVQ